MVYRLQNSKKRKVDNNMSIIDLYSRSDAPLDCVIAELDGFHGTIVNSKSIKYYFILDGKAKVMIDNVFYNVEKGDFIEIPINCKHSIEGKVQFAIICTPPIDFSTDIKLKD